MRRFGIIFRQEYKETLRSKAFIVISVTLAVILLCVGVMCFFLGSALGFVDEAVDEEQLELIVTDAMTEVMDGAMTQTIGGGMGSLVIDDRTGLGLGEQLRQRLTFLNIRLMELDDSAVEAAIGSGEYDACVIITEPLAYRYYEKTSLYGSGYTDAISDALEDIYKRELLESRGISESDANEILYSAAQCEICSIKGSDIGSFSMGKYFYNYMMIILLFLVIGLYGQRVASRVATEKGSRTMELLATSATPGELMCGKVMGVGAAAMTQTAIFIGAAFGMVALAVGRSQAVSDAIKELLGVTPLDIVWLLLYFTLGFLMIAFVYGGLGSMVSQVEDLSGITSLPLYVFMMGYFIAIFSTVGGKGNPLLTLTSMIPFWSPVTMFARMSVETVPVWQIVLSLALLAGFSALMAWASARLYRAGMLRYGKTPRMSEIISVIRGKQQSSAK